VKDVQAARRFYGEYLGLGVEEISLGWVARYRTEDGRASVQVVTRDATLSVHVGDGHRGHAPKSSNPPRLSTS
jgi:hypothetical protein